MSRDPLGALPSRMRTSLPPARAGPPEPMLATPTADRFSGPEWLFERKLDGLRVLAEYGTGTTRLWSRNHRNMNESYPELVDAVPRCATGPLVADGEIVAFEGPRTSFARLQERMHLTDAERIRRTGVAVYCYLFDLLRYDGLDLTGLPLRQRKSVLRAAVDFGDPVRLSPHRNTDGEAFHRQACARGWEGVIAKRADSRYRPGRSASWLKFRCVREQEFVIGGFTDPSGARLGFGALLVGYYDDGRLRYAGKVGTGYDDRALRALRARFDGLAQDRSPFRERVDERTAHWLRPELVAQVAFTEWTTDGKLRHPRYLGLREDKPAGDVVRE